MQHNNMFKQEDFVAGFLGGWGIVFFVGFAKRTFSVSVPVAVPAASPAPASVGTY